MNDTLYLFVGKSSSGKTTVASQLEEKYGCKQVFSYTTRAPRYDGEIGHIFISNKEFDALGELAAYTVYNGYRYGTTFKQLNECNVYVIDIPGVQTLLEKCKDYRRKICVIYFDASVYNRIQRMSHRGDSDSQIVSRLLTDEKDDWHKQLDSLVWHYANNEHMNIVLHKVDADNMLSDVLSQVVYYMNKCEEE
jgi:guanylate kinase